MYLHNENQLMVPSDFYLPFGGKLNPENKWCQLATIIPWARIEELYVESLGNTNVGQSAYSSRLAFGSLYIQNSKTLSDRSTLDEITENPYLQYFIGLSEFSLTAPFDSSLMVHFRKRFSKDIINEINEMITLSALKQLEDKTQSDIDDDDNQSPPGGNNGPQTEDEEPEQMEINENFGKLILDATCTPADVHYPTDLWLLNTAREAAEEIIDKMHEPEVGVHKKPRTYRIKARKQFLIIDKMKKKGKRQVRKAIGQQLRYVCRDIKIIEEMAKRGLLELLDPRQYRNLLVIQEIYRQQNEMYQKRTHQIDDRIVSLHMPFIRPIVRGKASVNVEFGAKLSISVVNGFAFMERTSFDAYNEGTTLIESVMNYHRKFGAYPEAILADKIYRNRENLRFCKENNIRLSGPPLGRPTKDPELLREQVRQERKDSGDRNAVEGKFGEGKRFYGLNRIMTRLSETSETVIAMQLLVMNLEKILRILLAHFYVLVFRLILRSRRKHFFLFQD